MTCIDWGVADSTNKSLSSDINDAPIPEQFGGGSKTWIVERVSTDSSSNPPNKQYKILSRQERKQNAKRAIAHKE
jgi:hypothetical protein